MSGTVMTVLGPIVPERVGPTLMHEHILVDLTPMVPEPMEPEARRLFELPLTMSNLAEIRWSREGLLSRANIDMSNVNEAVEELHDYALAGGRTVVEVSPIGLRRDIHLLPDIARRSRLNIVAGTAFFVEPLMPAEVAAYSAQQLGGVMIREFERGIGDTGVRPGVIGEIGTSSPLTDNEAKSLRASVIAAEATGMAMVVHLDPWAKEGHRVVDVLENAGAELNRVVIGHLNPTLPDLDYHRSLAERGVVLGYDLCGYELVLGPGHFPPRDRELADALATLVADGLADRVVLSQDTSLKTDYLRYGGWGYAHILRRVLPLVRERGIEETAIQAMLVATPTRLLTLSAL